MTYEEIQKYCEDKPLIINETMHKMYRHLTMHDSVSVGVSGGSDSNVIVHIIATYFREFLNKCHFVFQNTGLEFSATKRHLKYIEDRYDIHIDRIRGDSVVTVVRQEGIPVISKSFSNTVRKARGGAVSAMKKINGEYMYNGEKSAFNFTPKQKTLAYYIIDNDIKVSDKCCDLSKKKPLHEYLKLINADLIISGERKCEGGQRAMSHKGCFEEACSKNKIDKYMPLWFWTDEEKRWFKETENIRYSDCYEVWGMKRTGCVGCPFNSRAGEELDLLKKYEPNLYKACLNVFGESYRLMDKFEVRRKKILQENE